MTCIQSKLICIIDQLVTAGNWAVSLPEEVNEQETIDGDNVVPVQESIVVNESNVVVDQRHQSRSLLKAKEPDRRQPSSI